MTGLLLLLLVPLACVSWLLIMLHRRNAFLWLPAYISGNWPGRRERGGSTSSTVTHIMFCVADHFEPGVHGADIAAERRRVEKWARCYPELFAAFRDADGRAPRHTFFYPAEQYRPEHLERLGELTQVGYGEVEIHLHHDNDTAQNLRKTLKTFMRQLREHGHLGSDSSGRLRFGFVHGNWCLDNSRPDGRWCGINDEIKILAECGCYADFTMPSAPSPTQTRRINSIYYSFDDPALPKSHDDGIPVSTRRPSAGDLMMVQGPLGILWSGGKFGVLPRFENGCLDGGKKFSAGRARGWVNAHVCVEGKPDWVFVKLHTHGCLERNWPGLFNEPMLNLRRCLHERYNSGKYALHYVTAREMYNIIKAAEQGKTGNPNDYRDFEIAPPPRAVIALRKNHT